MKIFLAKWDWNTDNFIANTQDDYVINKGSFAGKPEIVDVKWYKGDQAMVSVPGSQAPIINQALEFLKQQ